APEERGCDLGVALLASLCPANLDRDCAVFDPPAFAQALHKSGDILGLDRRCGRAQNPDRRQLPALLRPRRQRPSGNQSAQEGDELAPSNVGHSITSSARAIAESGTSRPSAFAVLRLITSSYLVGCCIGNSPGFAPRKTRST